jgi:elongation factor 1 alpha-like protein
MSRHQAFRSVQSTLDEHYYDEEDEGYDDEEGELSPEDQALMEQGTADVRTALGVEASKVTTAQIQEALWHYYYDVEKSVTYLMTKFIAPAPAKASKAEQKPKSSGEFDRFPQFILSMPPGVSQAVMMSPRPEHERIPPTDGIWTISRSRNEWLTSSQGHGLQSFSENSASRRHDILSIFHDMPWLNIPKHRETVFIEPKLPRGGLLGGSGAPPKLTKLQQLAAARKKKTDEKKSEEKTEKARQKLSELSVDEASSRKKENAPSSGAFGKRQKLSDSSAAGRMPLANVQAESPSTHRDTTRHDDEIASPGAGAVQLAEETSEPAQPSIFAQTLLGSTSDSTRRGQMQSFAFPYPTFAPPLAEAFSKPSPDDVVLAAQAKGSIIGKEKR